MKLTTLCALVVLAIAPDAGCSRSPYATADDARAATFQIAVDVTTSPSLLDDGAAESHRKWTGTAWVAEYEGGHTRLVTAGHVCESKKTLEDEVWGIHLGELQVRHVDYKLVAADGTEVHDLTVLLDDDDADLCVLAHMGWLAAPLPVADADPRIGEHAYYFGAARRVWGGGVAMSYQLHFDGRGAPFAGKCGDEEAKACEAHGLVFSGPVAGGASGSAVLSGGRVVGVINLASPGWQNMGEAVPWDVLRRDLARAAYRAP